MNQHEFLTRPEIRLFGGHMGQLLDCLNSLVAILKQQQEYKFKLADNIIEGIVKNQIKVSSTTLQTIVNEIIRKEADEMFIRIRDYSIDKVLSISEITQLLSKLSVDNNYAPVSGKDFQICEMLVKLNILNYSYDDPKLYTWYKPLQFHSFRLMQSELMKVK